MFKYKIAYEDKALEFATLIQAENFVLARGISINNIIQEDFIPGLNQLEATAAMIDAKIKQFQEAAPTLMRELYVQNTMAGISTAQSDTMFEEYLDVLIRIREGAFPTALYRLNQKQPSGFVTQELINAWKAKLISYMV
jgi:hypothetical protein